MGLAVEEGGSDFVGCLETHTVHSAQKRFFEGKIFMSLQKYFSISCETSETNKIVFESHHQSVICCISCAHLSRCLHADKTNASKQASQERIKTKSNQGETRRVGCPPPPPPL